MRYFFEPTNHENGIKNLTEVIFAIPFLDNIENDYLACFREEKNICLVDKTLVSPPVRQSIGAENAVGDLGCRP